MGLMGGVKGFSAAVVGAWETFMAPSSEDWSWDSWKLRSGFYPRGTPYTDVFAFLVVIFSLFSAIRHPG